MNCDNVWELLSVYADGEATVEESALVETHVAGCADCARDLAFMQSSSLALQAVPEVEPPVALRQAILAATVNRPTLRDQVRVFVGGLLRPVPVRYGAVAAAAATAVIVLSTRQGQTPLVPTLVQHPVVRPQVAENPITPDVKPEQHAATAHKSVAIAQPTTVRIARNVVRHRARPTVSVPAMGRLDNAASGVAVRVRPSNDDADVAGTDVTPASTIHDGDDATQPQPVVVPTATADATAAAQPSRKTVVLVAAGDMGVSPETSTLAGLKHSLRSRNVLPQDVQQSIREREIRLSVIKGTF